MQVGSPRAHTASPVVPRPPAALPVRRSRILVADDDLQSVQASAALLGDFEVAVAESGEEALRLLRGGAEIDLLVASLDLAGRYDGVALARQGRALRPSLRVVYTSAYAQSLREDDTSAYHGELVQKPFTAAALRSAVARALITTAMREPALAAL